jgi:probable phosphoglycerate mutase
MEAAMVERIYVIRHCETQHHVQGLIGGWADFGLTAHGVAQASCLAARLKQELAGVSVRLICSDLLRAHHTAEIVGQALAIVPQQTPALRACSYGIAEGRSPEEVSEHWIPATDPLSEWQMYPGAESYRQVYDRAIPCVEGHLAYEGQVLLLVAHRVPCILIVHWWLGLALDRPHQVAFYAAPASVTVLRKEEWGAHAVVRLNDTAHLHAAGLE